MRDGMMPVKVLGVGPEPLAIRASSLPLVTLCPASLDTDGMVFDDAGEAAHLGTAVHRYLADCISSATVSYVDRAHPSYPDFAMLANLGLRCWDAVKGHFPSPATEQALEWFDGDIRLTGHADVLSTVESPSDGCGQVRVCDFKTGRTDEDYDAQLRGYALLGLQKNEWADDASVCLIRVREQTADWGHYTRKEILLWWEDVRDVVLRQARAFRPGRHCGFCHRGPTCPGKLAVLQQAALVLTDGMDECAAQGITFSHLSLARILDNVKLMEKACESARAVVRAQVELDGTEVEKEDGRKSIELLTGDGRKLCIEEQKRKVIDPEPAWPILQEALGDRLVKVLKVSKGAVEEEVKATAPPRGKGKAVKELMERLDQVGAMRIETTQRLEVRRAVGQISEVSNGEAIARPPVDAGRARSVLVESGQARPR